MVIGIDIGLKGGIATKEWTIPMPTRKIEVKPAIYVNALVNGKKQYYKSGPDKGKVKRKIKTPAKFKEELDLFKLQDLFQTASIVVIETPGTSAGNAAKATASVNRNYGKLLALAELTHTKLIEVAPHKWKKDLSLSKDKTECVLHAEKLSGLNFHTNRGALIDGPAEAWLIHYWYKQQSNIKD